MHAACARPLHAHAACANSMKRLLAIQMCHPPPPPPPKNSRRSKGGENARAVAMGPLLAARLRPTGGGHTARTAGMRRTSRSRSITATPKWTWPRCFPWCARALLPIRERIHFLAPLLQLRAAAAPCPCLINIHFPVDCPATSLSIIFIACSPLLPPLRALPRQCLAAHRLLAAPEIHRRRNVRSATALAPCAPYFTCTLVASWRGAAAHAGAQTGSAPCSRKHCFPRGTRCLPLRTRALAATYAHSALCRLPRRLTCCALRPACQFATRPPAPPVPATQQGAPPPRNGTVTLPTASLRTFSS
jgi:hypothetical protein